MIFLAKPFLSFIDLFLSIVSRRVCEKTTFVFARTRWNWKLFPSKSKCILSFTWILFFFWLEKDFCRLFLYFFIFIYTSVSCLGSAVVWTPTYLHKRVDKWNIQCGSKARTRSGGDEELRGKRTRSSLRKTSCSADKENHEKDWSDVRTRLSNFTLPVKFNPSLRFPLCFRDGNENSSVIVASSTPPPAPSLQSSRGCARGWPNRELACRLQVEEVHFCI